MSTQLVVRIPEEQKNMLELIAGSKAVSVAEITRQAITIYMKIVADAEQNLFVRLARIGESKKRAKPPRDLSKNYKKYLYRS